MALYIATAILSALCAFVAGYYRGWHAGIAWWKSYEDASRVVPERMRVATEPTEFHPAVKRLRAS